LERDTKLRSAVNMHLESKRLNSKRVWVVVRVRPNEGDGISCVSIQSNRVAVAGSTSSYFYYDRAFGGAATQDEVCDYVGSQILHHALNGENLSLMAYGQTGSGKTHTMFGPPEHTASLSSGGGLAFRAVSALAALLRNGSASDVTVEFSFLEVYNDELYDLLDCSKKLSRQRSSEAHVVPQGLTRRRCEAHIMEEQVHSWLREGSSSRTVGKTVFNPRSSRSHGIVMLHLCWASGSQTRSRLRPSGGTQQRKQTRIYIVDLAGSERAGLYAKDPEQLKEGEQINLSLSALGRVVGALASGKCKHVPYRDSALTWLLKDAITGTNARVCLVATVHPSHPVETASTLRYAKQYSALQATGGSIAATLAAEVRSIQRRVEQLRHELDKAMAGDDNCIGWSRESLHGNVQLTLQAREITAAHPHLTWTQQHQTKYNVRGQRKDRSGIGRIRQTLEAPPTRDVSEPADGRLVATSRPQVDSNEVQPEPCVEVVFEGRHGRPPVVLWFPESALEVVQPPKRLLDAMEKLERAEEELSKKRSGLHQARQEDSKREQEWMAKAGC